MSVIVRISKLQIAFQFSVLHGCFIQTRAKFVSVCICSFYDSELTELQRIEFIIVIVAELSVETN